MLQIQVHIVTNELVKTINSTCFKTLITFKTQITKNALVKSTLKQNVLWPSKVLSKSQNENLSYFRIL